MSVGLGHWSLDEPREAGDTLPASWYTAPEIAALEEERIFKSAWQYVGLTTSIPDAGDYFTYQVGRAPVIVIRDREGSVNAFANVCAHRAAELISTPCGNRKSIQCPYHAWTYGLDGALRKAPRSELNPEFDPAGIALRAFRVDTMGPLIFANADPDARALADSFPGWADELGEFDPTLRLHATKRYPTAANWKVVVEGGFECYHCPTIHPTLATVMDVHADLAFEFRESYSLRALLDRKDPSFPQGETGSALAKDERAKLSFLFPNVFVILRERRSMASIQVFPVDAGHSILQRQFWFTDDVAESKRQEIIDFTEVTDLEDVGIAESVQRGLGSGFYDHGKLMLPSSESGVSFHQRLVHQALAGA